jgi:hypothetical protein
MTALSIQPPFPLITDIDGQPLEDGYIWIGVANLPPRQPHRGVLGRCADDPRSTAGENPWRVSGERRDARQAVRGE